MKKLKTLLVGMSVFALSALLNVHAAPLQGSISVVNALGSVKSNSTYCRQNPSECECIFVNGRWVCYIK